MDTKIELQQIKIPDIKKHEIATKLSQGVTFKRILDDVRENIGNSLKREDLITRSDLHNIKQKYNLNLKDGQFHKSDATSVDIWVEQMKKEENNCVSSLNRHVNSKKHKTNSLIKNAEIKITAFLAEHNISFNTMDHFSDLIKTCFPDSKIAKNIHLKRTKTTAIMKNVIGKCHKEYLTQCLREIKFSVLTDESTDISCTKQSCVVIRYFNKDVGKIVNHLFELSCVFEPNDHNHNKTFEGVTGENLFDSVLRAFNDYDIPFNNLIGFGSDGCNTCICHSLHLCATEACKSLPQRCEELTCSIYSFFSMSSKRNAQFDRILSERLLIVDSIYKSLNDPLIKLIFLFMDYILPKFTSLNSFFQSSNVVITQLHDKMVLTYKEILLLYMNPSYIKTTPLNDINPEKSDKFYQNLLGNQNYARNAKQFSCLQIKKKYKFGDPVMPAIKIMDPKTAISIKTRNEYSSLFNLINLVPRISLGNNELIQLIDNEWRNLPHFDIPQDIKNHLDEPDVFWYKLSELKIMNNEFPFKNFSNFALSVLCLPHSNTDCKSIFSKVNLIKVKTRSRSVTDTIQGCLFASQQMKINSTNCIDFNPSQKMIDMMVFKNLYEKEINREDEFDFDSD
ncbi:hypothetical protein QTP88_009627 [Uroleucon formosanum]